MGTEGIATGSARQFRGRKEVAAACDIHPDTVRVWENEGRFAEVLGGPLSQKRILCEPSGLPVFAPGWTRTGRCGTAGRNSEEGRASEQVVDMEALLRDVDAGHAYRMALSATPAPDPVTKALEAGEPAIVVAARARSHGTVKGAVVVAVAVLVGVFIGVLAYFRRHGLLPED